MFAHMSQIVDISVVSEHRSSKGTVCEVAQAYARCAPLDFPGGQRQTEDMKATLALTSILALAGCATAQSATTDAAPAASTTGDAAEVAKADTKDSGVRCRNVRNTGSRIPTRVCTTAEQRETAKENMRRMQNQSLRAVDAAQ